jgi:hypothetical protein
MSPSSSSTASRRLPRRAWVGIDLTQAPPVAAAAWRGPAGWRLALLGGDAWRARRGDGRRCCAGLPMGQIFTERIAPPPRAGRRQSLIEGLLDLRLPVPVESCAIAAVSEGRGGAAAFMTYAMPRAALAAELELQRRAGCPAERVVPIAHALWQRWLREGAPDPGRLRMLLHAASGAWTLLAGAGAELRSCLTLPAGDAAAVGRSAQVFAQRWQLPAGTLRLCGAGADAACAARLGALPALAGTEIVTAAEPGGFLALALAEEGARSGGAAAGNLRAADFTHPAALRRQARREWLAVGSLAASALLLLAGHVGLTLRGARELRALETQLTRQAERLAGGPLPVRGGAAVELARRELDARLQPQVESLGEPQPLALLPRLLRVAALRNLRFSSLGIEERRLQVAGSAASEADVAAWREAARREGLVPAIGTAAAAGGGVTFTGTLMLREALP